MTDEEILERLRKYFQTQVNNLNADEMAEGPFENPNEEEFGDTWEEAAARIDHHGGLKIRFKFGPPEDD